MTAAMIPAPRTLPAHPRHRLPEARAVATAAGWPAACPDPACREGLCAGNLQSFGGGPRSFPTCLHLAVRFFHDHDNLTLREADAMLGLLRPGEGWTLQPTPAEGETGWPLPGDGGEGPAAAPDALLGLMFYLGHPDPDERADGEGVAAAWRAEPPCVPPTG